MKSLLEPSVLEEMLERIQQLSPHSKALWGKMTVAQMLLHCTEAMKMSTGELKLKRKFFSRLYAPLLNPLYYSKFPFPKRLITDRGLVVKDHKDFYVEQQRLLDYFQLYKQIQTTESEGAVHPFLGYMTAEQWGIGMYKHLDHHLRQFGV